MRNGLTLNGTATMGNASALQFQTDSQTLDGNGEIVFGTIGGKGLYVYSGDLTIGPNITIHGGSGTVGYAGGLLNNGTITSDQGGEIQVSCSQGWTNAGSISWGRRRRRAPYGIWTNNSTVSIVDGGVLSLEGTWTNAGTIASTDSTVNLGGTFTLAALGDYQRSGGTVNLTGTFNNSSNLVLDAESGSWNLLGGTIVGGSVSGTGGAEMVFTPSGGTLDGVTMDMAIKDIRTVNAALKAVGLPPVAARVQELSSLTGLRVDTDKFRWDDYERGVLVIERGICHDMTSARSFPCLSTIRVTAR